MKITLAIPKNKKNIVTFLKKEISEARNIKDKATMVQTIGGLNKILNDVKTGLLYYYDGDNEELKIEEYDGVDFIYHCGKQFVKPENKSKGKYLLVAFDSKECTIGMLEGKQIKTIWHETSEVPGKHNKGGQSKARFQRARQESLKQWYKEIAKKLQEIVMGG